MDGIKPLSVPKPGESISYENAIELSLQLAALGKGHVEPNPCVGAVLVDARHNFVSSGYHQKFGEAHAEVNALEGQSEDLKGHTLYVTLEPCSHHGKTPPCCELLVARGVSAVVFVDGDPNPKVSGRGLNYLGDNGVKVSEAPANYSKINREMNRAFFHFFEKQESYIHLKWAQTRDGMLSVKGEQTSITGPEARQHSHFLRAQREMTLVGAGTVFTDNPSLNIRYPGIHKKNKVGIFDPELKCSDSLHEMNIGKVHDLRDVFVFTGADEVDGNIQFHKIPLFENGEFDLNILKKELHALKVQSVLVEGGATTIASFISQDVFDEISVYTAPKSIGENGVGVGQFLQDDISSVLGKLRIEDTQQFGEDSFVNYLKTQE